MLREIVIHIPNTPDPKEATKTDALITKDWKGRARLLSNQRFVTFVNRTPQYLEIRLIPRSAEINPVIKMNDDKTKEVSFVLTEVNVPKTVVKKFFTIKGERQNQEFGFARIDMWERYQIDQDGLQVVSIIDPKKYFVIKKDVEEWFELKHFLTLLYVENTFNSLQIFFTQLMFLHLIRKLHLNLGCMKSKAP